MTLLSRKLVSGIEIRAAETYLKQTYGGLSIGGRSLEAVERRIKSTESSLQALEPSCPFTTFVPTNIQEVNWKLPPFTLVVWFTSDFVHDNNSYVGSNLAVVFFQNDFTLELDSENDARLFQVEWETLSRDFNY